MSSADHPRKSTGLRQFGAGSIRCLILSVVALLLVAACGKVKEAALLPGSQVLALGDSLTAGAGVTPDEAWPSLLARRTGWVVINGGVNGDTSGAALQRLPDLLEEHRPVLVLVTLGGNDMLHHIPQEETIANLGLILTQIKGTRSEAGSAGSAETEHRGCFF